MKLKVEDFLLQESRTGQDSEREDRVIPLKSLGGVSSTHKTDKSARQ